MNESLRRLNEFSQEEARGELLKCCGSSEWANGLAARRPFESEDELIETSDSIWWSLEGKDWLEAFSSHPKIGEQKAAHPGPTKAQAWSEEEQAGTRDASRETMSELVEANRAYEAKFGYIFIVCATGKSTPEMLALLKDRLPNDPRTELRIAAREQSKITQLRLKKLLKESRESGV
ncbi:MAG TPA: 2-oxo-4-hydroxy-4-carboxy-5-ureidoimidazoline decarboxylase [Pyrinomonadaceae bacterium]|nr:2-oxo-4-hydroxy-4-carboxy-5-ureidoimidazoline decarboxylase [Pyrinomonadaceae bacterium]